MRVLIIEFVWQVKKIINDKKISSFDLIVSLSPDASYHLKKNSINFFESDEIINEDKILDKYEEFANNSIEISSILDIELQKIDQRFKNLNWKIFDGYHYCLKITYDQLIYYSEVLSTIINNYKPKEIVLSEGSFIRFNDEKLISSDISILEHVLKSHMISSFKPKITLMVNEVCQIKKENQSLKKEILNLINIFKFFIKVNLKKIDYLSVKCFEIDYLKKKKSKFSDLFFNYKIELKKEKKKYYLIENLLTSLSKNIKYQNLIKYKEFSFNEIFEKHISLITRDFETK